MGRIESGADAPLRVPTERPYRVYRFRASLSK